MRTTDTGKKRVAYIFPALPVGGAEKQLALLLDHLDRSRYVPYVCCLFKEGAIAEKIRRGGVEVTLIGLGTVYDVRAVWKLRAYLAQRRIDIVQTCLFGFDLFANCAARLAGVPAVISTRRERAVWKRLRHRTAQSMANFFVHMIVANSAAVKEFVMAQEGVPADKVAVIYNGIEPSDYQYAGSAAAVREELSIAPDRTVIATVSNFGALKGHSHLIRAAALVRARVPQALFLFVGAGPCMSDAVACAKASGVEDMVRFAGLREDIGRVLAACDLFAFPSLTEGFPNAVLEALCAGVPVVATRVGGIPEMIEHGVDGVLVPPQDPEALAREIVRLCHEKERARALAARGREKAGKYFSAEHMASAYGRLYGRLLSSP